MNIATSSSMYNFEINQRNGTELRYFYIEQFLQKLRNWTKKDHILLQRYIVISFLGSAYLL